MDKPNELKITVYFPPAWNALLCIDWLIRRGYAMSEPPEVWRVGGENKWGYSVDL